MAASTTLYPGVALITGAANGRSCHTARDISCIYRKALTMAKGIGKAISVAFAREGCQKITIADLSTSALEETSKEITSAFPDVEVLPVAVNVAKPEDVTRMLDET